MAKDPRDRTTIDLSNLREKIEELQRSDQKLGAMSLAQVMRYLIEVGIAVELGQQGSVPSVPPPNRTQINVLDLQRLADQLGIPSNRLLKAIKDIKLEVVNGNNKF